MPLDTDRILVMCSVDDTDLQGGGGLGFSPSPRKPMLGGPDEDEFSGALGLGELAGLTVTNEADPSNYDVRIGFCPMVMV